MSSKATILEPRNLDHIEGRLALLIQRMKVKNYLNIHHISLVSKDSEPYHMRVSNSVVVSTLRFCWKN